MNLQHNRLGTIYLIYCHVNGKKYYGQTIMDNPEKRITHHICMSKKGEDKHLYHAARKYGWHNFTVCWLHYKSLPECKLDSYEKFYILANDATNREKGYNKTDGGGGGSLSEETKMKMRKPKSEEHKRKIKENHARPHLGKSLSEERKRYLSELNKGKVIPEDSIRKQKETLSRNKYEQEKAFGQYHMEFLNETE